MKNIIKTAMLLVCGIGIFTACEDDNTYNPIIQQPSGFVLNTPAYSSSTIDLATSDSIPFSWSQPDYGFPAGVEYTLQVSLSGSYTISYADEQEDETKVCDYKDVATFRACKGNVIAGSLTQAVVQIAHWETEDQVPAVQQVFVRIKAALDGTKDVYSNVVTLNVVPTFEVPPSFAEFIYEIGNESGWGTAYPMRSPNLDGIYQSYNWLDGAFKFKPNEGDWTGDWGQNPEGSYGDLVVDGEEDCNKSDGSFPDNVQPAGFYQINVDLVNMKWSIVPVNTVGIIGDFNGWGGDVEMTYNADERCWEATTTIDKDGGLKFRANSDWAINWGGDVNGLTQDGSNINVEAGTYKFQLYLSYEGNHRVVITAQ